MSIDYKALTKFMAENVCYQEFFTDVIDIDEFTDVIYGYSFTNLVIFTDEQVNAMSEYMDLTKSQIYKFFTLPVLIQLHRVNKRRHKLKCRQLSPYSLPLYALLPYTAIIAESNKRQGLTA